MSLPSAPMTGKRRRAPSLRPIQLRWAALVLSDQSSVSRLSRRRWAYLVMWKNHWAIRRCATAELHRSHAPPMTCSLASTVMHDGHQLTGASFRSASPALKSCRKTHWVHL